MTSMRSSGENAPALEPPWRSIHAQGADRMKIHKLLASLLLPLLAIVLAALAQHLLTAAWPGIREIRFPIATVDSYFGVLTSGALCFLAGMIVRRRVGGGFGFACAVTGPLAFLCAILWALLGRPILELGARIAWLRPITLFFIGAAVLPFLAVILGWSYAGARASRAAPGLGP